MADDALTAKWRKVSLTAENRLKAGELFWEFEDATVIQYENGGWVGHESTNSELKARLRPLTLTAEKYNG